MLWLVFGLLTALFESLKDVSGKKALQKVDEYVVSWMLVAIPLLIVLPLPFFAGVPEIKPGFWWALLGELAFDVLGITCYMRGLKLSDLSLCVPLVTFTPLFMLLTSPLILGEYPNTWGIIGVAFIVGGSYVLGLSRSSGGPLGPFRALLLDRGARLVLLAAFLWSITANLHKLGINSSSLPVWIASVTVVLMVPFSLQVWMFSKTSWDDILTARWPLFLSGLCSATMILFMMYGFTLTLAVYIVSLKRLSGLLGVFWGSLLFKDEGAASRGLGALIMVLGVLLIGFAGS